MFYRASIALPVLATATAVPRDSGCNTGSILCCNSVEESNSTTLSQLGGLLGVALPSLGGFIGFSCSPLVILGLGGNSCDVQPVCCSGNSFGGLITLGCNPTDLGL